VVFAGDAHIVVPLTSDTATLTLLLSSLSPDIMPIAGDQVSGALDLAMQLLKRDGAVRGQVLLLSDGISDQASALERRGTAGARDIPSPPWLRRRIRPSSPRSRDWPRRRGRHENYCPGGPQWHPGP